MMTDSLQTEDGKKTLRQILSEEDFRELVALEQTEVKKSIEETLLSTKGEDFWKKAFEDPKFTESIAKSMKDQQEDVMKKLMEDASFLKAMEDFFGQPDMQKQMETILKSATMKEQYEKTIEETINSPLLQTKWEKLIKEAGKCIEQGKGGQGKGKKQNRWRWQRRRKKQAVEASSLPPLLFFGFINNVCCNFGINFSNWMVLGINRWSKIFFIPIWLPKWNLTNKSVRSSSAKRVPPPLPKTYSRSPVTLDSNQDMFSITPNNFMICLKRHSPGTCSYKCCCWMWRCYDNFFRRWKHLMNIKCDIPSSRWQI